MTTNAHAERPEANAFDRHNEWNPKLNKVDRERRSFQYYAGYSHSFVEKALEDLPQGSIVFDPWNGTGTTTTTSAALGHFAIGLDLNPVLNIVARAKLTAIKPRLQAIRILAELPDGPDYLISILSECKTHTSCDAVWDCLRYAAFCVVQQEFAKLRGSNPTWTKHGEASTLVSCSRDILIKFIEDLPTIQNAGRHWIMERDFTNSTMPEGFADAIITSPPYATRIDYVKATAAELNLLSALGDDLDLKNLRKSMLGTPLTTGIIDPGSISCPSIRRFLNLVKTHPSKASSTYYYRFYRNYLHSLAKSIFKAARTLKTSGTIHVVVQTSMYKEHTLDLPLIVQELLQASGVSNTDKRVFHQKRSMALVNTRSGASRASAMPIEAVVTGIKTCLASN